MIYFLTALAFFLVASYTDLKTREVPELLTTAMIALGLAMHAADSIMSVSLAPAISCIYMIVIAFLFSFFLYRIGAWAGGDVKLFTGLAAILPYYGSLDYFPFLVFAASFLAALPFAIAYISYFLITIKKLRKLVKPLLFTDFRRAVFSALYVAASYWITVLTGVHWLLAAPIVFVLYKARLFALPVIVIAIVFFFLSDHMSFLAYFASISALSFTLFFGIHAFKIARQHVLRRTIGTKQLREGDIPAEDIYFKGKRIADPKLARGLTIQELALVRRAKRQIKVKLSIPFVPVLTLGLVIVFILEKVIK
jgi:preflagellin peptidase FlaK